MRFLSVRRATPLLAMTLMAAPRPPAAPCVRPIHAGTQVQGDVRICPGRYRIADPTERGVIILTNSGTRVDLTGVTLESGDSLPSRFVGVGIASRGVERVTVQGGVVRGYRYGVRLEGGRGHRVTAIDVSGSRSQSLRSTGDRYDESDWLDIFNPDTFELYGGGIYLKRTDGASVTGVTARYAQNGIGLFGSRGAFIADNDVSSNSGWGIHLWSSSQNIITRNLAHHNFRCESASYSRGCDAAGLLLREGSDSNLVVDNDFTYSGDGFLLSSHRPLVRPSIGNLVFRNDASFAYHNAFESTFSGWNVFIENRADSSDYGFWLGHSKQNTIRRNTVIGSRTAAVAIEHGTANEISGNRVMGGRVGIRLFAPNDGDDPSQGSVLDDNTLTGLEQAIVLENTAQTKVRGNIFDDVGDALVVDHVGHASLVVGNVFLRVRGFFVKAPDLAAGGNFWATRSVDSALTKVRGRVSILPWSPASAAGY